MSSLKSIQISGADAGIFLQGFITCDINDLGSAPLLAAACNQKGRIIANFWIWKREDNFYLQLPESMVDILLVHLKKYQFRSSVTFDISDQQAPNTSNEEPIWIVPKTSEAFIPQMIGLEKTGGVSFTKGCYLGQEIIARSQHLGKLKRHLHSFNLETPIAVRIGDDITNANGQKIGTVVMIRDTMIFAVTEDRATEASLYWHAHLLN